MFDLAIASFFAERKEGWLKKKLKSGMTDQQKKEVEIQCEEEFSLNNWLPNAAKRAGQISISTHPCTFSHPSARKNKNGYASSIIAKSTRKADGFLRTGNVNVQADALGNAAALDVHKFLSLITEDGKSILDHIEQDTDLSKSLLCIQSESYDDLKAGFMAMAKSDDKPVTSSKIKQVYFPIKNGYHQLSLLSHSGIIFDLRKRVDALRFSDTVKEGRDARRNNIFLDSGYSEIYDVATIGYGGTKPQNISVLNNQNAGKSHLLMSVPPTLEKREIKFPKNDFFIQSLRYYDCKTCLERLDNIFKIEREGVISLENIRKSRDGCMGDVLDTILEKMIAVRAVSTTQFWPKTSKLKNWQKVWLCEQYHQERYEQDEWLDTLCHQIAIWINNAYKHSVKHAVLLGEAERAYIYAFISEHKEVLR